jgi:hypothetical protein
VLARRALDRVHLLDVVGHDDAGDGALGERDAQRAVDVVTHRRGVRDHVDVVGGHVLEERDEVDLLLVVAPERKARLLADDGDDWRVVHPGVVQAVEQVDGPGPRGRQADSDLAGELRVGAGGEGGELLVAHLDEVDELLVAVERAEQAVDAVARIAVDAPDAPGVEPLDDEVADEFRHGLVCLSSTGHRGRRWS